MNKIKFCLPVLALVAVILVSGCVSSENVIKVGFVGALTGDAAITGEENLNGVKLAVEKINAEGGINGKMIELIIKDDQWVVRETITGFMQLVNAEGVDYILTVTYGGFIALAQQTEQNKVILINSLDASHELANLSDYNFAIGIHDESIGYSIADYLNKKSISNVGLLTNIEDPFMLLVENSFRERYQGEVHDDDFTFDTVDFRTMLSKVSSYEYIVLLGWEETGRIVKQTVELGIDSQIIGIDTFASEDFRTNTNNNYEGLLFTFWKEPENNEIFNEMISNYISEYGKSPENVLFMTTGYDAMTVLGEAMKACGDDTSCVSQKLRNDIKDFKGASGLITIDSDSITRSIQETMHTYLNGQIVPI